jgi:hypothetical protein
MHQISKFHGPFSAYPSPFQQLLLLIFDFYENEKFIDNNEVDSELIQRYQSISKYAWSECGENISKLHRNELLAIVELVDFFIKEEGEFIHKSEKLRLELFIDEIRVNFVE